MHRLSCGAKMSKEYSVEVCRKLQEKFHGARLYRPMRVELYDRGTELVYDVVGIEKASQCRVHLVVDKFAGGGFAGQVYRVKITQIEAPDGPIEALRAGAVYAMKILVPPSRFSRLFRNALYWVGFQGPFQLQINPAAARAGALWQKFIRHAAKIQFGDQMLVADIYATFVDSNLGSCGELGEWIDGRTWWLEADDHMDLLKRWRKGRNVGAEMLGSPEYRAKRRFMADFVKLLHQIGAPELARQYEWSTCKSQPNCLKRQNTDANPSAGLVAIDFRAGLALLPFLPMSPGDFKLIWQGLLRRSLVQFDRGDVAKLEQFVQTHPSEFEHTTATQMLNELKAAEHIYRDSVPDITHNHIRLLCSSRLWSTILASAVTGWKVNNLIDQQCEQKLRDSRILALSFFLIGLIPFLGKFIRRFWGRADWRSHYKEMLRNWKYFQRAFRARIAEKLIVWHRAGRVSSERALKLVSQPWRFLCHLPFSLLPFAGLHRFLTDWQYAVERLAYIVVRPVRLYFNAQLREQWLREMLVEGKKNHMLTDEDAEIIKSDLKEPFIQKYLRSLVVHLCTLPVSEIVWGAAAWIYIRTHPGLSTIQQAVNIAKIVVLFQILPISPGSLIRGLYVLYLVIREWNFKDYSIAVFLSFFKIIGYLAFPIQMAYRYPALARFMAAHWATSAVHIVPVFGETGALLEHWVFCLFYNWPLTIRRRMRKRAQMRASMRSRYWHAALWAAAAAIVFGLADFIYLERAGTLPNLRDIWWLVVLVPLICGAAVTLVCGGAKLWKRIVAAVVCGAATGAFYMAVSALLVHSNTVAAGHFVAGCFWRAFVFSLFSAIGAILTEIQLPDPDLQ